MQALLTAEEGGVERRSWEEAKEGHLQLSLRWLSAFVTHLMLARPWC